MSRTPPPATAFAEASPAEMRALLVQSANVLEDLLRGGAAGSTSAERLLNANRLLDRLYSSNIFPNPMTATALRYGQSAAEVVALWATERGEEAAAAEWRSKSAYIAATLIKWGVREINPLPRESDSSKSVVDLVP